MTKKIAKPSKPQPVANHDSTSVGEPTPSGRHPDPSPVEKNTLAKKVKKPSKPPARVVPDDDLKDDITRKNFSPKRATYATRFTARMMAWDLLWNLSAGLNGLLFSSTPRTAAKFVRQQLPMYVTHATLMMLWQGLYEWGSYAGLYPATASCPAWSADSSEWQAVADHINWEVRRPPAQKRSPRSVACMDASAPRNCSSVRRIATSCRDTRRSG